MRVSTCGRVGFGLSLAGLLVLVLFMTLGNADAGATAARSFFVSDLGIGTACTQADPCDLQEALAQAQAGDDVYVAGGEYTGSGDAVVTISNSIGLYGGWDGAPSGPVHRDPQAHPSILDGEQLRRCVFISSGTAPTVDGFLITLGSAAYVGQYSRIGGGILAENADPIVTNNFIANNTAYSGPSTGSGGGIALIGGTDLAIIHDNQIISNTANSGGPGRGGGLFLSRSAATVRGNTIQDNLAGTTSAWGGGLALSKSSVEISHNVIQRNVSAPAADGVGGAIHADGASPNVLANVISDNHAAWGALSFERTVLASVINNVVHDNEGGGVLLRGSATVPADGLIANNTLIHNGDRGVFLGWQDTGNATATVVNNIIMGHTVGIFAYDDLALPNTVQASYNLFYENVLNVDGNVIHTGNDVVGQDPLFLAADGYHLAPRSPAIDAGTDDAVDQDIDGDPRPEGAGWDIGADEFVPPSYYTYFPVVLTQ